MRSEEYEVAETEDETSGDSNSEAMSPPAERSKSSLVFHMNEFTPQGTTPVRRPVPKFRRQVQAQVYPEFTNGYSCQEVNHTTQPNESHTYSNPTKEIFEEVKACGCKILFYRASSCVANADRGYLHHVPTEKRLPVELPKVIVPLVSRPHNFGIVNRLPPATYPPLRPKLRSYYF